MNTVTPSYVKERELPVCPLVQLAGRPKQLPIQGIGGTRTGAIGYVVIQVRVEGVPSYGEDQVALVVPDNTPFGKKVPVIIGTPTINRLVRSMKETEFETAPEEWQYARISYEANNYFTAHRADLVPEEGYPTNTRLDPIDLDEKVILNKKFGVPAFGTAVVHGRTEKTMMLGSRLRVMTQAPYPEDEAKLPNGLHVLQVYTELKNGSRNVTLVVRNGTSRSIHVSADRQIGRVVAANAVPEASYSPELLQKLAQEDGDEQTPLTVEQRQELLMQTLSKDGGLDILKDWPEETALKARRLLMEFHSAFSLEPGEMGCTDTTEHVIELTNDEPFKERFRRIAPPLVEEVRKHIQEMLDGGAIRPSQSPWCNAVVLVRKKDGTLRFCIDFRKLNDRTKKDSYPLPRIQESMEAMVGARHFSCVDLKSGFWQVKMDEESRQYTAFTVGSLGVYEFLRMPFGLCNAPATFQRLMQNTLGELNLTYALIYLDDVVVFSQTEEEHLIRLRAVLERFQEHGLKLKPSKCQFFRTEITYLGHRVSKDGMSPSQDNLRGIAEMAPPTTYTGVREFTGATGFYRRFIKGYSKIAKPLNDLLSGETSHLKKKPVVLTPEALSAFEQLKMKCLQAPVLQFADFNRPFLLETDASGDGLGAVLSQKQSDGRYHPVAYGSRGLKGGEKQYHSSKLEFLALKWAVTDHFREYLQYLPFTVKTDNNPLTYVLTTPNLDATGHRWVAALAPFKMNLEYVRGSDNKVADALSRIHERLDDHAVRSVLKKAKDGDFGRAECDDPRMIQHDLNLDKEVLIQMRALVRAKRLPKNIADTKWVEAQADDPVLQHVIAWLKRPKEDKRDLTAFLRETTVTAADRKTYGDRQGDFLLHRNLLYRKCTIPLTTEKALLFVVPSVKRQMALDACHRETGHQGRDRTLSLLRERFWWPKIATQAVMMMNRCGKCAIFEGKDKKPYLKTIVSTEPMDLVHIDFVKMELCVDPTKKVKEIRTVLVIVDHFTRYVQAHVVRNETARAAAEVLYHKYFTVFGFPRRLMSDQARAFEGKVIQSLCNYLGIEKIRTTPYHPQSNGQVERTHQTLMRMIGKLDDERRQNWPSHLGSIVHAYNATRSQVTGYSPYYLMFGRRPRLPIDLIFPTARREVITKDIDQYVAVLYDRLREAVAKARLNADHEAQRQKRNYDKKAGAAELRPGDQVLIRLDAYIGMRRKLKNKWGDELHTVVRRVAGDVPSYVVEKNGHEQTIHRSRLLLWLAEDDEPALRANLGEIILDPGLIPSDTPVKGGEDESVIVMSYGLNLATFESMLNPSESGAGDSHLPVELDPLQEETSHEVNVGYGNEATRVGAAPLPEDVP